MDNHRGEDEFPFSQHVLTPLTETQYFIILTISFITELGSNEETQYTEVRHNSVENVSDTLSVGKLKTLLKYKTKHLKCIITNCFTN